MLQQPCHHHPALIRWKIYVLVNHSLTFPLTLALLVAFNDAGKLSTKIAALLEIISIGIRNISRVGDRHFRGLPPGEFE